MRRHALALLPGYLSAVLVMAPTDARSGPIVFHDEASFLAAAGDLTVDSFEDLLAGTASSSFVLQTLTLTADRLLTVVDTTVTSRFTGDNSPKGIINYDHTVTTSLTSTDFVFTLNTPTNAFGLWLFDWGTYGP